MEQQIVALKHIFLYLKNQIPFCVLMDRFSHALSTDREAREQCDQRKNWLCRSIVEMLYEK